MFQQSPSEVYNRLLAVCLVGGQAIAGPGYDAKTWGQLLLLTLCAQLLGHTLLNRALASAGATTVSLAILLLVVLGLIELIGRPPVSPAAEPQAAGPDGG